METERSVEVERAPLPAEPGESSQQPIDLPTIPSSSPGGRGRGRRLATVALAVVLAAAAIASLVPAFLGGGEAPVGSPTPTWVTVVGTASRETGVAVAATSDSVYVAGETTGTFTGQDRRPVAGPVNDSDVYLARVGVDGETAWVRQVSLAGNQEATAVAVGQGTAFVIGATRELFLSGLRPPGLVAAFDREGTERWRREMTGVPYGVATDETGVYVTGIDYPTSPPPHLLGDDVRGRPKLWKFGFDGTVQWSKRLATVAMINDIVVVATGSGRVCAAGTTDGVGGAFVGAYEPGGRAVFSSESLTGPEERKAPFMIACDRAGIYVGGLVIGELAPIEAFVERYSAGGRLRWARSVSADRLVGMASDSSAAYLGVLSRRDSLRPRAFVVTKFGQDGSPSWSRSVGEVSEFTASVSGIALSRHGLYVVGTGILPGGAGGEVGDAFLARFAPDLASNGSASRRHEESTAWPYLLVVMLIGGALLTLRRLKASRRASRGR